MEVELEEINQKVSKELKRKAILDNSVEEKDQLPIIKHLKNEQETKVQAEAAQKQLDWQKNLKIALTTDLEQAEKEKVDTTIALSDLSPEISEIEDAIRHKADEMAKNTLDEFQSQVAYWTTQAAVVENELANALMRQKERAEGLTQLVERKSSQERRIVDLEQTLANVEKERVDLQKKAVEFNVQLEELRTFIEPAEKELTTAEEQENELQKLEIERQAALARVERLHNQLQLDLNRKQEAIETLRGRSRMISAW